MLHPGTRGSGVGHWQARPAADNPCQAVVGAWARVCLAHCHTFGVLLSNLLISSALVWSVAQADSPKRLTGTNYLGDMPTVVASELGFFSAEVGDLAVEFGHSGLENLRALRAGETDFALMALTPLVLELLEDDSPPGRGGAPVILASISHSIGLNFVMARDEAGIQIPDDLAGKRIGVMRRTNAEFLLNAFLEYHGLSIDSVTLRDMPTAAVFDGLLEGRLDAGVLWEPWVTRLETEADARFHSFEVSNVYTARWLLVTRDDVVAEQFELGVAVLQAYRKAIDYMDQHPDEAIELYASHGDLPAELVRERWDNLIYGLSLNWSLLGALQQQIEWARDAGYGVLGRQLPPLSLIEPAPLREIMPQAVNLPPSPRRTELRR